MKLIEQKLIELANRSVEENASMGGGWDVDEPIVSIEMALWVLIGDADCEATLDPEELYDFIFDILTKQQ